MRHAVVPLALVLAFATGIVLAEARLIIVAPIDTTGVESPGAKSNAATVRRFYDAVNAALSTGEVAPLNDLLALDLIEHTPRPGLTPDRDGLCRYLRALHATKPSLWLAVLDIVAQGDRVTAVVRVDGASGDPVPGLPPINGRAWGTIDVFRLQSNQIVEHWGDDAGLSVVEPLLAVSVPVELPTAKVVEVGRQTYPSDAADAHWADGPTILFVESGTLTVEHDRISTDAATVIPATAVRRPLAPGDEATLAAGDSLVLGRRSLYRTRNEDATPAVVLTIWSGNPTVASGISPAEGAGVGGPGTTFPTMNYEALGGGLLADFPARWAVVTIGRIALAPGAVVARHRVTNFELAVVESGSLAVYAEGGKVWARDAPNVPTRPVEDVVLTAGGGILLDAGTTVAYRPRGDGTLQLLLVTIGPDTADAETGLAGKS